MSSLKGKKFLTYILQFAGKKKNSFLSFCDLSDYSNCKDFVESPIMLIWICRHYSIINGMGKNHSVKKTILLIKLFFILKLSVS